MEPATNPNRTTSVSYDQFAREALPVLNRDVLAGRLTPDAYFGEVVQQVTPALDLTTADLRGFAAEDALRALTLIATSIERIGQGSGLAPGAATSLVPGLEQAIIDVARAAEHPPHASAESYWLWNPRQELHFESGRIGHPERIFGDLVRVTNHAAWELRDVLAELSASRLDPQAKELVDEQVENVRELQRRYQNLMPGPDPSQWPLTPVEFACMRNWLTRLHIAGESKSPANAANLASVGCCDLLLGTVSDFYRDILSFRLPLLPARHRERQAADARTYDEGRSVVAQLAARLRIDSSEGPDINTVAAQITPELAPLLASVVALAEAWAGWAGTHRGMITKHLERFTSYVDTYEPEFVMPYLTVPAESSVGGVQHDVPEHIRRTRHDNPIITTTKAALKLWRGGHGDR